MSETRKLTPDYATEFLIGENRMRTVLVVDDNEINREILGEVLEDDYQVLTAENGQAALDLLRSGSVGVSAILLDLLMPVMDGRTFLREAQSDPELRDIPVLVVTGDSTSEAEYECLDLGASDFIPKPVNPKIAKKRVASAIRLRESNSALSMVGVNSDTGLLSRQAFIVAAEQALARHPDKTRAVAVGLLADFAAMYANCGRERTDETLRIIGEFTASDPLNISSAYLGEGRVCLLRENGSASDLEERAVELCRRLEETTGLDVNLKFGVVEGVRAGDSIPAKLSDAIDAAKRIENDNRTLIGYHTEEIEKALTRRRAILAAASGSLAAGDFFVVYQPKHEARNGKVVGAEALVRWIHPTLGFVSPGEFIPLFEETGFVGEVDDFVRKTTVRDMIRWHKAGLDPIAVSVNFSRKELEDCDLVFSVVGSLSQVDGIPREMFHAEVTETMWSNDTDSVMKSLRLLKGAGCLLELDDFGSGYSSLSMVAALPLDVIKLDMSLVRAIDVQEPVIECAVDLSHKLGRVVVAEGVEDEETVKRLAELGVDVLQGYYFSKPLPYEEFTAYLAKAQGKDNAPQSA